MEQSKFDADLAIKGETTARSAFTLEELVILGERDKRVGEGLTADDIFRVVEEENYKKVLAEVNFQTGNVEFRDAGNYMEVPISTIQGLFNQLSTK